VNIFAKLYTDEDIAGLVGILLRAKGFDVTTTPSEGRLSSSDEEQLEYATSVERCILTHNRVDFERLHLQYLSQGRRHAGILVVPRKNPYEIAQRALVLLNDLTADEFVNQLYYL
jgi:uncharacterized protein with PIN domain